eukprot:symbB.v1.2.040522.t1/scaffold7303.1/size12044/1
MSKALMSSVFKVLRNGLLRYILYACPNLMWIQTGIAQRYMQQQCLDYFATRSSCVCARWMPCRIRRWTHNQVKVRASRACLSLFSR